MDVAVYLKEILLEKGDAFISGLGGFSSQYQPAYYEEATKIFYTPYTDYYFQNENYTSINNLE
ncbi:MAG: hypothetical protein WCO63_14940, partial [Bacteroidota bacterium]